MQGNLSDKLCVLADSLVLDKENSKEINMIAMTSLDQLESTRVSHSERVSDIRSRSEQCIQKDYLVRIPSYFLNIY